MVVPALCFNRRIFNPRFFMLLSNYLLITTTTLHSVYSNDVNSLSRRQMLLSVYPDATAAWRRSLEVQNSCLVLNWHFARRAATLWPPTSSGAAARASSVCQKRMSFSGNKKLPLHVVSYLWRTDQSCCVHYDMRDPFRKRTWAGRARC